MPQQQAAEIQLANLIYFLQKFIEMSDRKHLQKLEKKYQEFLNYLGKHGIANLVMKVVEDPNEKQLLMDALLSTDIRAIPSPTENAFLIAKSDQEAFERLCNKVLFESRNKTVSYDAMLEYASDTDRGILEYEFNSIEDATQFVHKINATQMDGKNFITATDNEHGSNIVYIMDPKNDLERAYIAHAAIKAGLDELEDDYDIQRKSNCIKYERFLMDEIKEKLSNGETFYLADGLNETITKKNSIAVENNVVTYFDTQGNIKHLELTNNMQNNTAKIFNIMQQINLRNAEVLSDNYYQNYMVLNDGKTRKAEIEKKQEQILNAIADNKELCGKNSSIKGYARPEFTEDFLKKSLQKLIHNDAISEIAKLNLSRILSGKVSPTEQNQMIQDILDTEELDRKEIYTLKIFRNKYERSNYDAMLGYMIEAASRNINYEGLSADEIKQAIISNANAIDVSNVSGLSNNQNVREYMMSNRAKAMIQAALLRCSNPNNIVNTKNVMTQDKINKRRRHEMPDRTVSVVSKSHN